MAIQGNLQAEEAPHGTRRAARRELHLEVSEDAPGSSGNVTLLNLSATGALLRTADKLLIGEQIRLSFPDGAIVTAEVVWSGTPLFGCRFKQPIGHATLSAATLKSRFDAPEELPAAAAPEETLGSRITRLRSARGLSLQSLADKVGVSKPALWKWERGDVRPRPAALARLADILGVPPVELVFGRAASEERFEYASSLQAILDEAKSAIAELVGLDITAVELTVSIRS